MKLLRKYRLQKYIMLFSLIVIALTILKNKWPLKDIDFTVYKLFYFNDSKVILDERITVIDLPSWGDSENKKKEFRKHLGNLLDTIQTKIGQNNEPKAIFLDYYFDKTMTSNIDIIRKAIKQFQNTKVYAVFNLEKYKIKTYEERIKEMDSVLYNDSTLLLEGGGKTHTLIYHCAGVISYDAFLKFKSENIGFTPIIALPLKIKNDIFGKEKKETIGIQKTYILPIGDKEDLNKQTYQFIHEANQDTIGKFTRLKEAEGQNQDIKTSPLDDMNEKFIIIGSLEADKDVRLSDSGPKLLAWALNDQLYQLKFEGKSMAKSPFDNSIGILVMVILFSCIVAGFYSWLFKSKKKLQTRPFIISIFSILVGLIPLFSIGSLILLYFDEVLPVGMISVSMFAATVLSWSFHKKLIDLGLGVSSEKYDIFISYSGKQRNWVIENVLEPLKTLKKSDDTDIKIFFDQEEIEEGAAFVHTYKTAITNSKIFIPIMTEDYFDSAYCRKEMSFADGRAETDLIRIYPIAFDDTSDIPSIYRDKNITIIKENVQTDFIGKLKNRLDKMDGKKSL